MEAEPKIERVKPRHIAEEWSEAGTDDGYWIMLKPGWCSMADPIYPLHQIHERNKTEAHRMYVRPCNCEDCKGEAQ